MQLHFAERVRLACQTTILGNVAVRRLILDANDAGLTDQRKDTTTHGSVGEEREIAILFVDIRNSTRFADSVPPFDVIHVLRRNCSNALLELGSVYTLAKPSLALWEVACKSESLLLETR